jgi:predicted nuclease of predicted toxin-antitoxin system
MHVRSIKFQKASDQEIWDYAKASGYVIASKDTDFHQMSFVFGAPPKVIWIRQGNCSTEEIATLLHGFYRDIGRFEHDHDAAFLAIG